MTNRVGIYYFMGGKFNFFITKEGCMFIEQDSNKSIGQIISRTWEELQRKVEKNQITIYNEAQMQFHFAYIFTEFCYNNNESNNERIEIQLERPVRYNNKHNKIEYNNIDLSVIRNKQEKPFDTAIEMKF